MIMRTQAIIPNLRLIASRMLLAFDTPETVVDVLGEFEKLFQNEDNYKKPEEWGTENSGKEIPPFALSEKGLSELKRLRDSSDTFISIYNKGTAGLKEYEYNLVYFLTQYIIVIASIPDFIFLINETREPIAPLVKKIEVLKDVTNKVSPKNIYDNIVPMKKYTAEEAGKAKRTLINLIKSIREDFEKVEPLSEKEEKYFHTKKK